MPPRRSSHTLRPQNSSSSRSSSSRWRRGCIIAPRRERPRRRPRLAGLPVLYALAPSGHLPKPPRLRWGRRGRVTSHWCCCRRLLPLGDRWEREDRSRGGEGVGHVTLAGRGKPRYDFHRTMVEAERWQCDTPDEGPCSACAAASLVCKFSEGGEDRRRTGPARYKLLLICIRATADVRKDV